MVTSRVREGFRRRLSEVLAALSLILALIATPHAAHASDAVGGTAGVRPPLWVEAELQPDVLHVQAQARYTLRLYQAVSVRELAFHGPQSALAEIRPSGENIREVTHENQRYRVTERHYAVIPFASGTLQLAGAGVSLHAGGASLPGRRIDAPPLAREVRAVPPGQRPEQWLPARAVTLIESWQPDAAQLLPGQALRRTIRIEAKGVAAAQIPPLHPAADGFSVHPEPPRLEERDEDGWTTGIREQSWRLVPRQGGEFALPAVHVPWWDVIAQQPRHARLAERSLAVLASPVAAAAATDRQRPPREALAPGQQPAPSAPVADPNAAPNIAFLVAVLVLVAAGAALIRRHRDTATLRRIRRACRHHDPLAARTALLQWSREIRAPGPVGLLALARQLGGSATRHELAALDRHLYGEARQPWNGHRLIAALRDEHSHFHPWWVRRPGGSRWKPVPAKPAVPLPPA